MTVVPHDVAAHWFWWGAGIGVVLGVARYVVASRRVGRKPNPYAILALPAVLIGGALLAHSNSPWQFLILSLVPATFLWGEVERPLMGVSSFAVSHGKPALVLRGTGRRGDVELALSRPSAVMTWGWPERSRWEQPTWKTSNES